jgi:hypothetical protein
MNKWLGVAGWISLAILLTWTLALPGETFACSPTATPFGSTEPTPGPTAYALAADIVIEGEVIDVVEYGTALVAVERYYKGRGPAIVTITGFGEDVSCRDKVAIGEQALFYGRGSPYEQLSALHLRAWHSTDPINDQVIREVTEATGQAPLLPEEIADIAVEPVPAPNGPNTSAKSIARIMITLILSTILLLLFLRVWRPQKL